MKKFVVVAVALAALSLAAAPAQACHRGGSCCESGCNYGCNYGCGSGCGACCTPCCAPQVSYVEQTVTCYRQEMRQRQVPCTVNRVVVHTEVVPQTYTVCVPTWHEERRTITVCTCVPRQIERQVCCTRMVPVCVTDPCTGCTHTCCKPECYTQTVTCTVMEQVPVQKEISVRVCSYHQEQRTCNVTRCVPECKTETVMRTECYCVCVPYQVTVKVPVCTQTCGGSCGGCGSGCCQ